MPTSISPAKLYRKKLDRGELRSDPLQAGAVEILDRLHGVLAEAHREKPRNWFERVTGLSFSKKEPPRGVYLYGGVGRGKSMLMDLFFQALPEGIRKRRVHFHAFMIGVHDYIHSRREDGLREGVDDVLPALAERIAEQSAVLCFDEFHVTDVADAMILGRLFTALFGRGVVVVATSNFAPEKLYEGGLQRDRFLPFIALLESRMDIVHLDGPTDYRSQRLREDGAYFWPLGPATQAKIDSMFAHLTDGAEVHSETLAVKGRDIPVSAAAKGVARFTFSELCERPHGAEDFLMVARTYRTVFLENVPYLGYDRRNEAKRLMILIDALYDTGTKLVVGAEAPPDKLYRGHDHAFEFQRTVSRLLEMQGPDYLAKTGS